MNFTVILSITLIFIVRLRLFLRRTTTAFFPPDFKAVASRYVKCNVSFLKDANFLRGIAKSRLFKLTQVRSYLLSRRPSLLAPHLQIEIPVIRVIVEITIN